MVTKHSSGPWEVTKDGLAVLGATRTQIVADLSDTNHNRNYHPTPSQTAANAALIAAAPELLEAAKSLCGVFEGQEDVPRYVVKARAALARAEHTTE